MNKYNTKITKIENVQEVTHLEEFDFLFNSENYKIKYLHNVPHRSTEDIENDPYAKSFGEFVDKMKDFIPNNSEVIDVGAYDGDTSLSLALMAGKNGRCINFECGPAWQRLQINSALNKELNLENYNYAASNVYGVDKFNYNNDVGGSQHKTSYIGEYPLKRFVRTIDIDNFLNNLNISNLSLIKLDTEGFDVQILNFMDKYIDKFRPLVHIEWFPSTENELYNFLINKNYNSVDFYTLKLFDILPNYWAQDLILIPKEKVNNFKTLVR
jgi:FkbM family methyltransferase